MVDAHIIVTPKYFIAIKHHVECLPRQITSSMIIHIYKRMEFDYISHKIIGEQEWSHANHYYAINDQQLPETI